METWIGGNPSWAAARSSSRASGSVTPGIGATSTARPSGRRGRVDRVAVDHGIDQHRGAELLHVARFDVALHVVHAEDLAVGESVDADERSSAHHTGAVGVVGGDHVDA